MTKNAKPAKKRYMLQTSSEYLPIPIHIVKSKEQRSSP